VQIKGHFGTGIKPRFMAIFVRQLLPKLQRFALKVEEKVTFPLTLLYAHSNISEYSGLILQYFLPQDRA
jgi:hypothetical protein